MRDKLSCDSEPGDVLASLRTLDGCGRLINLGPKERLRFARTLDFPIYVRRYTTALTEPLSLSVQTPYKRRRYEAESYIRPAADNRWVIDYIEVWEP